MIPKYNDGDAPSLNDRDRNTTITNSVYVHSILTVSLSLQNWLFYLY